MPVTVYGIANCDTVKKARQWLQQHHIEHEFHDFRRDGLSKDQLQSWLQTLELETLLNKRSRTWRELDDQHKTGLNKSKAIALMLEQPSLIKRPLLSNGEQLLVGFDTQHYKALFGV